MKRRASYASWWRPLPLGLKLVTVFGAGPAWLFIVYCVVTGQSKSRAALIAFAIFAISAILHIAFDSRNRRGARDGGGVDLSDGGE